MWTKNIFSICICLFCTTWVAAQSDKELTWNVEVNTIKDSHYLLKHQMGDSLFQSIEGRQVKRTNRIIKSKRAALKKGKKVFTAEFGDAYEIEGRRFLVHFIKGYWIVKALLPEGFSGGTLVTVFDSESGKELYTLVWK